MELSNNYTYGNCSNLSFPSDMISVRLMKDYDEYQDRINNNSKYKINNCMLHSGHKLEFYCRDCNVRLCRQCFNDHRKHDTVGQRDIVTEKIENIASIVEQFTDIRSQVDHVIKLCSEQQQSIAKDQTGALDKINEVFKTLHESLDQYRNELINELKQVADSCMTCLHNNRQNLEALRDDVASVADIANKNESVFNCFDLFELHDHVQHKIINYKEHHPLESLRPNRLSIQVKWTSSINLDELPWKKPLAKINCHLSPERLTLLQRLSVKQINDKKQPCIISCSYNQQQQCFFLCDAGNKKIKISNTALKVDKCFIGAGKYSLSFPSNIISFNVSVGSQDNKSSGKNEKQSSVTLISDPGGQKVVSFNQLGLGIDLFETQGYCEALCVVPRLSDLDNCRDCNLELLPVYNGDVESVSDISLNGANFSGCNSSFLSEMYEEFSAQTDESSPSIAESAYLYHPAALLCCQVDDNYILECIQVNSQTGRLYKSRPDLTMNCLVHLTDFHPNKMTWNSTSNLLFLLDSQHHKIVIMSGQNAQLFRIYGRFGQDKEEFNNPSDILIDPSGHVLISDKYNNRIHVLDSLGNFLEFLCDSKSLNRLDICEPTAMCFDEESNLLVFENGGSTKVFTY